MTKSDEIQILREAAARLGPESYCGPWLAEIIPFIEQDIRSDLPPIATVSASRADAARISMETTERCAEITKQAEATAAEIIRKAYAARDSVAYGLRQAERALNGH